ncbi:hypothetical protein ACFO9Q_17025 [Paenibacillus sp. GCM10023252]|uniref:hypothetical protein n=1 Tax=Paenibacillus sp. GCM10023252 TaxID=3252649 RepID=UPI00361472BC
MNLSEEEPINDRKPLKHQNHTDSGPLTGPWDLLNVNEEMGTDYAVDRFTVHPARARTTSAQPAEVPEERSDGFALGWVALLFAGASWFIWPILMGLAAAVLGFVAYRQGAKGLGVWSITIGLIAATVYLVLLPFYYAIT